MCFSFLVNVLETILKFVLMTADLLYGDFPMPFILKPMVLFSGQV